MASLWQADHWGTSFIFVLWLSQMKAQILPLLRITFNNFTTQYRLKHVKYMYIQYINERIAYKWYAEHPQLVHCCNLYCGSMKKT